MQSYAGRALSGLIMVVFPHLHLETLFPVRVLSTFRVWNSEELAFVDLNQIVVSGFYAAHHQISHEMFSVIQDVVPVLVQRSIVETSMLYLCHW